MKKLSLNQKLVLVQLYVTLAALAGWMTGGNELRGIVLGIFLIVNNALFLTPFLRKISETSKQ